MTPQAFRPCPVHPDLQQLLVWVVGPSPVNTPRTLGLTPTGDEWAMWGVERPPGTSHVVLGRWRLHELRWFAQVQQGA